jgi:hypothetical protein
MLLSQANMQIGLESKDPLGEYRVTATITDRSLAQPLTLERRFTVKE